MHWQNMAEKAISTFKDHFKAILVGVDKTFLMHLCDRLFPQADRTKIHNLNKLLLVPMGCAVLVYNKPEVRKT